MITSNDSPIEVQVEMLADSIDWDTFTAGQLLGWMAHEDGRCSDWPPATPGAIDWWAGWLCREMSTMVDWDNNNRDSDAWPWDPTRPVAGQYEEWLARRAEVDAFASDAPGPLDGIDQSEPEPAQSIDLGGEAGE